MNKLPKVIHKGILNLGDLEISCAVLDNGERILVDRSLALALGVKGSGAYWSRKRSGSAELPEYIAANYLTPYISGEQRLKLLETVVYTDKDGEVLEGVSANLLVEICDIWQKADKEGALDKMPNAKKAAHNAYIIFKGFAQVGITALIDEATGYQYFRARNSLEQILDKFISTELRKWAKTFPDEFYELLFRLRGEDYYNPSGKRPAYVGKLTNDLVYERIAPGVLEELKRITPKDDKGRPIHRYHQRLTEDVGHPRLREHLASVITLMRVSSSWDQFYTMLQTAHPKQNEQMPLLLAYEKAPPTNGIRFDKAISKALPPVEELPQKEA